MIPMQTKLIKISTLLKELINNQNISVDSAKLKIVGSSTTLIDFEYFERV